MFSGIKCALPFQPFLVFEEERCAADERPENQRLAVFKNHGNRVERFFRRLIRVCEQAEQRLDIQLQQTCRLARDAVERNAEPIAQFFRAHFAQPDEHLQILIVGLRALRRHRGRFDSETAARRVAHQDAEQVAA